MLNGQTLLIVYLSLSLTRVPDSAMLLPPPPESGSTFALQDKLPKLPIPPLDDTCRRYLRALEYLQDEHEHAATKAAVQDFLQTDGPRIQEKLKEYAKDKARYKHCDFVVYLG